MPGAPLSLDVEQVPCTLMDVFEICGQRRHKGDYVKLHTKPGPDYHGRHADRHVQFPCRVMWGNGVTWAVMVTTREVLVDGTQVALSAREWAVLEALVARPGAVLSRAQLEEKLYSWRDEVSSNAVEVYIHGLRKKLGSDLIQNVRGVGYMVPKA